MNYVLGLNRPYEEIFANYTKHRRKDIRKAERLGIKIIEVQSKENFVELFVDNYTHLSHLVNRKFLNDYVEKLIQHGSIILCDVVDDNNSLIAAQMFIVSGNRRICMGFVRNKLTENHNASAFVIDDLIQKSSGSKKLMDFEGSDDLRIASFMLGFNPIERNYIIFSNFKFSRRLFLKRLNRMLRLSG